MADVTLKDIAAAIGIDASTVSRALDPNKSHMVKDDTIVLVLEAARQLGYRGDRVAGALRRGKTGTIGVVVADLGNPFIAPVIHGIAKAIASNQMLSVLVETNDEHDQLESSVDHLLGQRVDAVIVAAARFGDRAVLEDAARHTPLVLAVRGLPGSPLPQVLHDDVAGGAVAARYLLGLGHRRIAELRGPNDVGNFAARHEGFQRACDEVDSDVIDLPEYGLRPTRDAGEHLTRLLLDLHGDALPTAVFAHNDLMALGALSVFREHGLRLPDQMSLVGYNDSPIIDQVDPPLASVAFPGIEIGMAAGKLAMLLIHNDGRPTPGAVFAPELRERGSAIQVEAEV